MNRASLVLLTALFLPAAHGALPGDAARGKTLHDANCLKCHDTGVYTRKDRRMKSVASLQEQMGACSHAAQVILTDDEQRDIMKYLNEQFYKFR